MVGGKITVNRVAGRGENWARGKRAWRAATRHGAWGAGEDLVQHEGEQRDAN